MLQASFNPGKSEGGAAMSAEEFRVDLLEDWPLGLYQDATDAWGKDAQITLAQEELAELNVELARYFRGRNDTEDVVDEIADVLIAANQLALIFGKEKTEERVEYKLRRLRGRVDESQGGAD